MLFTLLHLRHSFRHVACCLPRIGMQILSSYHVDKSTRPFFYYFIPLLPAEAHSLETICLFFTGKGHFDFVLHSTVIADYQDMPLGEVIVECHCWGFKQFTIHIDICFVVSGFVSIVDT